MKNNLPHILWKTGFHCSVDELMGDTFSMNSVETEFHRIYGNHISSGIQFLTSR